MHQWTQESVADKALGIFAKDLVFTGTGVVAPYAGYARSVRLIQLAANQTFSQQGVYLR